MTKSEEKEYWEDIRSMAEDVWERCDEECEECQGSDYLHESVDGSQWVIYYARAVEVLRFSSNDDQIFEELGDDALNGCTNMGSVYTVAAFYAMKQDVIDELENLPDTTLTYTLQWEWDLEYWPEDAELAVAEEHEDDSEEFNTLKEARTAMDDKEKELKELLKQHAWTSCKWHLSITDSDGEEHEEQSG